MTYSWALIESHISTLVEVLNEQGHVALAAETSRLLKKNLEEWYEMATDSEKGQLINVLFRVRKEIKERRWTPHTARDVWERVKLAVGAESPLSSTSSSPVSSPEHSLSKQYRAIGRRAALHYGTTKEEWEAGRAW